MHGAGKQPAPERKKQMIDYTEGAGIEYHVGVNKDMIGRYVIMPGDPGRCEKIAAYLVVRQQTIRPHIRIRILICTNKEE